MEEKPAEKNNYSSHDYAKVKDGDHGTYTEMGDWHQAVPQKDTYTEMGDWHQALPQKDAYTEMGDWHYVPPPYVPPQGMQNRYDNRRRNHDSYFDYDRLFDNPYSDNYRNTHHTQINIDGTGILIIVALVIIAVIFCSAYDQYQAGER